MARYLLISFTGILRHVANGTLNAENLSDALFYFGCVREHALDPSAPDSNGKVCNELEWATEERAEQHRIHGILKHALLKAENEGRAIYRQLGEPNRYEELNNLLVSNGFQPLDFDRYNQWGNYNYPTVEQAARDQGLSLEVLWR